MVALMLLGGRPLRTYLINLDRAPDRLVAADKVLQTAGLPYVRIAGVDGRMFLNKHPWPDFSKRGYRLKHGKAPEPGQYGCYMSHITVLRQFAADPDAEIALVLEDDAEPLPDFLEVLESLASQAGAWDMVKLNHSHKTVMLRSIKLPKGRRAGTSLTNTRGSSAYLINKAAARRFAETLLPVDLPWDHSFDRSWVTHSRTLILEPPIVKTRDVPSTIAMLGQRFKLPLHHRITVPFYRLYNEVRRVVRGFTELLD